MDLAVIRSNRRRRNNDVRDIVICACRDRVLVGERVTREGWREIIVNTSSQASLGGRSQAETLLEDCTCGEQV